jgi:uncharacterized protein (DUF305 family)
LLHGVALRLRLLEFTPSRCALWDNAGPSPSRATDQEIAMKSTPLFALALSFGLGVAVSACAGAYAHDPKTPEPARSMAGHSDASMQLHQIMMKGPKMSHPMTGDVDRDFAGMMSKHHQQAIDMVDVLLEHGDNAELKAMARKMKAAQQQEIKDLARFK